MLYVLFRILFAVIVLALFFFFTKKMSKNKKMTILIILCIGIALIFCFPIEGCFLRFNSVDEAYNYSTFNQRRFQMFETEKSVFIVSGKNEYNLKYYTITKYGNQYGVINYNYSVVNNTPQIFENKKDDSSFSVLSQSIINTESNNSMLEISVLGKKVDRILSVKTQDGKEIDNYSDDSTEEAYNIKYYYVLSEPIPSNYYVTIDGYKYYIN